ncbi:hypothetical protein TNCV_4432021 [Trichonephila clavipes]|nr:hypothetical protein TNCV_4432021 [Trichonephila clavipes]
MVAQRMTQINPPAATSDQLWQRVEAAWSPVPQKYMQSLFESMPRRVATNARSIAFSQRTSSMQLFEDETSNDSEIINNLMDYMKRTGFFDRRYNIGWDPAYQEIGKEFS